MTVLGEQKCHQLRMDGFIAAEIASQKAADEISIYRSVVAWEMYIFELSEDLLEISPEFLYLGGFSGSIQSFEYYKHNDQ